MRLRPACLGDVPGRTRHLKQGTVVPKVLPPSGTGGPRGCGSGCEEAPLRRSPQPSGTSGGPATWHAPPVAAGTCTAESGLARGGPRAVHPRPGGRFRVHETLCSRETWKGLGSRVWDKSGGLGPGHCDPFRSDRRILRAPCHEWFVTATGPRLKTPLTQRNVAFGDPSGEPHERRPAGWRLPGPAATDGDRPGEDAAPALILLQKARWLHSRLAEPVMLSQGTMNVTKTFRFRPGLAEPTGACFTGHVGGRPLSESPSHLADREPPS